MWIGGNVVVCPGVTIGQGSTVGAGSVVTKVSRRHPSSFPVLVACAHIQTRMLRHTQLWQATLQRSSSRRRETLPQPRRGQRSERLQILLEFLSLIGSICLSKAALVNPLPAPDLSVDQLHLVRVSLRFGCSDGEDLDGDRSRVEERSLLFHRYQRIVYLVNIELVVCFIKC